MVQTPAVKIGETINWRRVETSLCLEDLAEGSRVSVFVPCPGGMVEAGTGSAIPPQRWAVAISPIQTRLSESQYRQSADHQAVHALNKALEWAELSFVRMTRVRPLSTNHRHRGNGLAIRRSDPSAA